jgi:hypothetical protein
MESDMVGMIEKLPSYAGVADSHSILG